MKRLIPFLLLISLTFCPATTLAQPSPGETFPKTEGRRSKFLEQLNLSPQQKQQLEAIRQQSQPQLENFKQQLTKLRQEMVQLNSSNASEQQLRTKFQEVQSVKNELGRLRFEQMLAMREILTPEQRTRLEELMSQRRPRPQR